jgi:hypothetical protein
MDCDEGNTNTTTQSTMTTVPSEILNHVQGFVNVEDAVETSTLMEITSDQLVDEMRSLGLNPETLIAKERLRRREHERLKSLPEYALYKLIFSSMDFHTISGHLDVLTIRGEGDEEKFAAKAVELGYPIDTRTRFSGRFVVNDAREVFNNIVRMCEMEFGRFSQVDQHEFNTYGRPSLD